LCFASLLHFIFLFLFMFCKFVALYFLVSTYGLQGGPHFQLFYKQRCRMWHWALIAMK
jgi:hypothetical protein